MLKLILFNFLLRLLLVPVTSMRRRAPPPNVHIEQKKSRSAASRYVERYIPADVMSSIFCHVFDSFSMKRQKQDPLLNYKLVSKQWKNIFDSGIMAKTFRSHPVTALLILKREYSLGRHFNRDVFKAALDKIDKFTAIKLLFKIDDLSLVNDISELRSLKSLTVSDNFMKEQIQFLIRSKCIPAKLLPAVNDNDPLQSIDDHLSGFKNFDSIRYQDLIAVVGLSFLDDFYRSRDYSSSYEFLSEYLIMSYRAKKTRIAKRLLDDIRSVRLPSSG